MKSITIPKGVEELGLEAFGSCTSLESVVLSEGVIKVGESCFNGCQALKSLTLPSSLSEVGSDAFQGDSNIKSVYIPDIYDWCSIRFENDESDTVPPIDFNTTIYVKNPDNPDEYVAIKDYFYNWELDLSASDKELLCIPAGTSQECKFVSIRIPASVESIGAQAFSGATLKTIYITGGDDVCALLNNNAIPDDIVNTYVPEGLVEQYKEEENWSEFADRIEKLPEEV